MASQARRGDYLPEGWEVLRTWALGELAREWRVRVGAVARAYLYSLYGWARYRVHQRLHCRESLDGISRRERRRWKWNQGFWQPRERCCGFWRV